MSRCMRTTLTLDDDVAAILERLRKSRDASLKDLVNEALRRGLKDMSGRTERHAELLGERECMAISQQMPIWPHWLWNTGLRYARQTVINGIEDFVTRP